MPSIKAYTQYETLAFCQLVAYHGSDTVDFEDISVALNDNELIRESDTYDHARLTVAALQSLYHELLDQEKTPSESPTVNGDDSSANGTNPRKRKLSASPAPPDDEQPNEQSLLQSLVNRLYARFREQTLKEIRQEEEDYLRIQDEIAQLEQEETDAQNQTSDAGKSNNNQYQPPLELIETKSGDTAPKVAVAQASSQATPSSATPGADATKVEQVGSTTPPPATGARTSPSNARNALPPTLAPSYPPPSVSPALASARASAEPAQARTSQPPPPQGPHQSPGAFHRTLPVPSPQRPNYGPINPQHFQPGPQGQPMPVLPQYAVSPQMPPPTEYPPPKRGSVSSTQSRGSPTPGQLQQPQQPYPGYSGYPQQPPWPHQPPAVPYGQPPPFSNQPYYHQSPPGRHPMQYQTPHHPPFIPYAQSAPVHYQGPPPHHAWPPQPQAGQPYYGYPGSANVTPIPRSDSRHVAVRSRSSTPWKRRPQLPGVVRPSSPVRPDREVSPISDTETPTRATKSGKQPDKTEQKSEEDQTASQKATSSARGRQQASATPSAFAGSRSQSIASFASDTPTDKHKKARATYKIKPEPPSTPAAFPSDTEQQSQRATGRRGRPRAGTLASKIDDSAPTTSSNKRKRSPGRGSATPPPSTAQLPFSSEAARAHQASLNRHSSLSLAVDPSLVAVTKNFGKTSQLLLNEINSHKLAGIFAKPLSERDAPGYKDLVLRPQDLKSIKAAIFKGGKAALAAIEAFEEKTGNHGLEEGGGDAEKTPTRNAAVGATANDTLSGERALGNGVYLIKATEDLVPPKSIVNSAQLEMELVRMFANAVMFNPLPSSERGFGPSLRLRKRGGDVAPHHNREDEEEQLESSESDESTPSDVGGIISDTREMCEDVMAMVKKWREVELERLGSVGELDMASSTPAAGLSTATQGSEPNASFGHSETLENEDEGGSSTPSASATGTARKRRRIAGN
ncbi:hypothetical protein H2200_002125 [Cladophialophora chaetospira]|uniref:Bromo domain-containing protein n=1 Tax=Cladophialophora chaetospira TaxID=386627 RepID=A0AA39CMR7_9EURO|nr:hypothetical protein H2200_002125 [Cladophialophora chaetospira]